MRVRNRQKSRADIPLFEECGRACQTKRKAGLKISIKLRCTFLPEQDYSTTYIICYVVVSLFFARIHCYYLDNWGEKPKNFFDIFKNAQKLNIYSDKDWIIKMQHLQQQ